MRFRSRVRLFGVSAVAAAVAGFIVLAAAAAAPHHGPPPVPPGAIVVGNGATTPAACMSPDYTTIQEAIDSADAGSTIYVCAGTYPESLTISKPLVLDGAQFGADARSRSGPETIVTGSGGIHYTAGATSGTIDGFSLNGYAGGTGEVVASNVGSGWTFVDNIVDVSNGGFYLNTNGETNPPPTTIAQNRFIQETPSGAGSGDYGQAVLLWANTANNVTISNNDFVDLTGPGAAINTTQGGCHDASVDPAKFGNDLKITGNTFVDEGVSGYGSDNFMAVFCTTNALISDNTATITNPDTTMSYTAIYLGGGDWGTTVARNTLSANGQVNAAGVNFNSDFYPAGTGLTVSDNVISGFVYGIHIRPGAYGGSPNTPSYFTITKNTVNSSVDVGIRVLDGLYGSISHNRVSGSGDFDCYDGTSGGPGTAGTYNAWVHDLGATSSPAGLCPSH